MKKQKKKKKFGKIVGIAIIVFVILMFLPVDEEESDEQVYDSTTVGEALSGTGQDNREELVAQFGSGMIRDYYAKVKGNGEDRITLLVYMNGSDLESEGEAATKDLKEMVAGAGISDQVNILVQTMGTKSWAATYGISSKKTQRYRLDKNGLELVDDSLKQLDCTKTSTLADFIKWGAKNYPADRYMLIFWNHGGGAVYGFGNDEWVEDEYAALTIDEMQAAFREAGVFFDFIGMDCCIMSSMEVCCAFYDYCDYTILSEDFESGLGWYYTDWIRTMYNNTSIATKDLGIQICDDMVKANTTNTAEGDNSILALVDETMVKFLYSSWKEFAYQTESTLTSKNFSRTIKPKRGGRLLKRMEKTKQHKIGYLYNLLFGGDVSLEDYYEVDIMSAASTIDSDVSDMLKTALANTLTYVAYSSGDSHLTGLAVSLPYGDRDGYESMREIFGNIGLDREYINWLERFVDMENSDDYYDYDSFDDSWSGWDDYEDDYEDEDLSLWDIFFGDDDDDYGFDDMEYDDFDWGWD